MLMHMPAEDAFWLLAATIKNFAGGFYDRSLSQVQIDANVFESLLRSKCRKLADTLKKNEIQPVLFITKWFITFFTSTLPWETVLRVWDMFYYDGIKAFFRVALAIMKSCEGLY